MYLRYAMSAFGKEAAVNRFVWILVVLSLSACERSTSATPNVSRLRVAQHVSINPIQHIVVVVQENRTFDNIFQGYPGADTRNFGYTHDGTRVMLKPVPLYQPQDIGHDPPECFAAVDNGAMDGFNLEKLSQYAAPRGKLGRADRLPYQYTQQSDVQPLWDLASQSALADRMFETNCGPSFPAHQYLIAGQPGYLNNPLQGSWGCDNKFSQDYCFDYTTIGDELDNAGLSWRYYFYGGVQNPTVWAAYNAIRHIRYGPDWTNGDQRSPETKFLDDIGTTSCTLPNVVWLTPSRANSDHAGGPPSDGDHGPAWVATVVNALAASPCWRSTTVIVMWDDWGGWYDHVPPHPYDSIGLGMRVPLIVAGPFAKIGYISQTQHEFGSILNYIEGVFALPSMGTVTEQRSDDLRDCFNALPARRRFHFISHGPIGPSGSGAPDDD